MEALTSAFGYAKYASRIFLMGHIYVDANLPYNPNLLFARSRLPRSRVPGYPGKTNVNGLSGLANRLLMVG